MATEKIKLQEEDISEILVTDIELESGAEDSKVENKFEQQQYTQQQQQQQQQQQHQEEAEVEPEAATSGRLPT
jgi:hypothetical protein